MNLDIDLNEVSLSRLSNDSKNLLSSLLNTTKVLKHVCPDHISRYRDWRGLASLVNISTQIEASIKEHSDKVGTVIGIWQCNDNSATVGQLMLYMQLLDRFDIYDDLLELARNNKLLAPPPNNQLARIEPVEDNLITFHDAQHGTPQLYHAYVLFAPQDRDFVDVMLARLRDIEIKLCTDDDLLPGFVTRFDPVARLVSERCRRIILVFSPDFFNSPAVKFITQIAQAHGIAKNTRNLLPIRYRPCVVLPELTHYFCLDYPQRASDREDLFWRKLIDTLHQGDHPSLRNGSVSSASAVRIQELPSNSNGYLQYKPIGNESVSHDQASSRFTPRKEEHRLALPEARAGDSGSVTSLPTLPNVPISPVASGSVPSLLTEPLPPYHTDPTTISDISREGKSKKKNRVERFFSQVRSFPSRMGKKKKDIAVES